MAKAQRGEVWVVDLGLAAKVRPALILNAPFTDTDRALYAIVPHTTAMRGARFEVNLRVPGLEPGAFDVQGLRNIPPSVLMRRRAILNAEQMAEIERAVKQWLGIG